MPAISTGKVLVTGANGFIAAWAVKAFLGAGFAVRGTVRSNAKAEHLTDIFRSYGETFEYTVVSDMTKEGAFDEALRGIDAIVHTASPVNFAAEDPAEVIDPTVNGTLSLLCSAAASPAIKRIVMLSSGGAVITRNSPEPRVYDETCWNDADVREVEEKGRDAHPFAKYMASKVLAERRAWQFYEENKAKLSWELVTVTPPWVFGPILHEVGKDSESLTGSNRMLWEAIFNGAYGVPAHSVCWVDIRDLGQALVLSVTKPEAGGQRFVVSAGTFTWEDFAKAAYEITKKAKAPPESYDPAKVMHMVMYDTTKSKEVLGLEYRYGFEETTRDVLKDWEVRGWL
ncbi:NAD-P-binding protein [Trametes coccinea BRFM310]|uniref:NAD-P-binding protein n=1 Tax=Trametes coccinea (strain BRFM310) TaxID=1353009 RepID=A0A1Y2J350_TRAC3|nr:NAD-P-binding protein [Trametes coccinea BRFM310]